MENRKKAERILAALDNSKAPISWHCIDEEDLILAAKTFRHGFYCLTAHADAEDLVSKCDGC